MSTARPVASQVLSRGLQVGMKQYYKVIPEETGGLSLHQAQAVIDKTIEQLGERVDIGPWNVSLKIHPDLGTIIVELKIHLCKKGWRVPREALDAYNAKLKRKEAREAEKKAAASKEFASKSRQKRAR